MQIGETSMTSEWMSDWKKSSQLVSKKELFNYPASRSYLSLSIFLSRGISETYMSPKEKRRKNFNACVGVHVYLYFFSGHTGRRLIYTGLTKVNTIRRCPMRVRGRCNVYGGWRLHRSKKITSRERARVRV